MRRQIFSFVSSVSSVALAVVAFSLPGCGGPGDPAGAGATDDGAGGREAFPMSGGEVIPGDPVSVGDTITVQSALTSTIQRFSCTASTYFPCNSKLLPASQWVCALTQVQGKFVGGGERVQVTTAADGYWYLQGTTGQVPDPITVGATCYARGAFLSNNDPDGTPWTRLLSQEFTYWVHNGIPGCAFVGGSNTWWGDAATFLTGMSGKFMGGGESAYVIQSTDGFSPSLLTVSLCQDYVQSWGYAFFVGPPSKGRQATFNGPNGNGPAIAITEYAADRSVVLMAPTAEAMCYFSYISGKFAGGGEIASISPFIDSNGVERWALGTSSGQGFLGARARCYRLDQRVFIAKVL
jgi:hypothetical protein